MSHANAPLTAEGRHRLIQRCQYRAIAHVAAEAGISRACLSKWKSRFDADGFEGLHERSSAPFERPTMTSAEVVDLIETWRRERHWSARAIRRELQARGHDISLATVGRWLKRLGISRLRDLDPDGDTNRVVGTITARFPGHMVHLDVKKVGRIPDGGGHRVHGRGSAQHRACDRAKTGGAKGDYVFLHSMVDGYSRLAYTEHLADEKASTTIGFYSRARAFFRAHGIDKVVRVITDNGSNYRAKDFTRVIAATASKHQFIRPYTPRHNGKVERYNRTIASELLYARIWLSEAQRAAAVERWNIHYNYHRDHTAIGDRPPASRLKARVTNVMSQNTHESGRGCYLRRRGGVPLQRVIVSALVACLRRAVPAQHGAASCAEGSWDLGGRTAQPQAIVLSRDLSCLRGIRC